jgi:hypothetical protein
MRYPASDALTTEASILVQQKSGAKQKKTRYENVELRVSALRWFIHK